ncbi:flagellar basal-body rod protein FlgF [Methylomonas sp. MED-D]|uniref:Flagellar basal-body rod protein FlgF n=1 Tax=Methylomonas koyamae TaxID=702114 RepID=A0A177PH51_9GAMM|nr:MULTISPECIES: flagellar basal-body rod protein FlgF [Methylomonas]MDT4330238.1 flagellar basal-body rod protein FlgF [Methylomonas sp. MV1]NJA08377.1 flagellar basal-body rod protein FlgF [Methylococcaceae bacterium WWC4]OAI29154.1 flagellar biosynthesis protein FlgF [Methylomonas koyamae]WGS86620.1 flagellar basal-body rod protein FlgF [Methylomonas sp. UP202]
MDRSLYIAMNGAKQTLLAQTANANNLANTQTPGFKSDFEQFRAMPAFGPGYPTRVYAMTERPGSDLSSGALQTTGNELDVAINGPGWISVTTPDGKEAYTRAGDLRITPEGQLQTSSGLAVVGEAALGITIPPARKIDIGDDGTINIVPQGENSTNTVIVDRIKLVNPDPASLEKREDGLMHTKDGAVQTADANVVLVQGALENSNVNPMAAMVEMIELSRNFDLQSKVMKTADETANSTAKIMQVA